MPQERLVTEKVGRTYNVMIPVIVAATLMLQR
jgi:hypothetical protein